MGVLGFGVMDLDTQTRRIDPDDDYIPLPLSVPDSIEFPTPSRTPYSPLSLFPWDSL